MKIPIRSVDDNVTEAGQAEHGEVIRIKSPENHRLSGVVEIVWDSNELSLEFRADESVSEIVVGRMDLSLGEFVARIWEGE